MIQGDSTAAVIVFRSGYLGNVSREFSLWIGQFMTNPPLAVLPVARPRLDETRFSPRMNLVLNRE
jgi:hypothetical protein